MRSIDLSPFRRSSVGFDRMLQLLDNDFAFDQTDYPPYNIARTGENAFRISLALPGYKPEQVDIIAQQNMLTVSSKKGGADDVDYVHRGIKAGPFEQRFNLADYVEVKGASFIDGLLLIDLERVVPDALKPRRIEINDIKGNVTSIDQKKTG